MQEKIIICDAEKCTGCRICEYICAAVNEGRLNPRISRIKTIKIDPVFDIALTCRKCDNPKCVNACARNAISQNKETKLIEINSEKCDGCGYCILNCSFGVLTSGLDKKVALVCDTCITKNNGKPACVDYCPKEALKFLAIPEIDDQKTKELHNLFQTKMDKK
jgi:carbon-monoxide dehydrogenase iron sulfur subunit